MGEHKNALLDLQKKLVEILKQDSKDKKLSHIYPENWATRHRPLTFDFVANQNGKEIFIDIIGCDDWRQLIGKAVCYSYEIKKRKTNNYEIWILTNFMTWGKIQKMAGDPEKQQKEIESWKRWFGILKDILNEMIGKDFSDKIFFKHYKQESNLIEEII